MLNAWAGMRFGGVLVDRDEGIGVFGLEIGQSVMDLSVLGLVCPDVQQQISHALMALGHVPVLDGNVWSL